MRTRTRFFFSYIFYTYIKAILSTFLFLDQYICFPQFYVKFKIIIELWRAECEVCCYMLAFNEWLSIKNQPKAENWLVLGKF